MQTTDVRAVLKGWLLGLLLLLAAGASGATSPSIEARPGDDAGDVAGLMAVAISLEAEAFELDETDVEAARDRLQRAAPLFLRVGELEGGRTQGYWRAARSVWLAGEMLPLDATEEKMEAFREANDLADRGIAENPDCAECMLWKFIAMGRLRTTSGMWEGIKQVGEMAELLDRAIALNPTHRDGDFNSTLGNLHYSSAIFYRLVPEWFWLKWVLGIRGDKERALAHSRKALELHPQRLDYQIEVGTQLLCLGTDRHDDTRLAEGLDVLRDAVARGAEGHDDEREIYFARIMIESPEKACGYSGDKVLEVDEKRARRSGL